MTLTHKGIEITPAEGRGFRFEIGVESYEMETMEFAIDAIDHVLAQSFVYRGVRVAPADCRDDEVGLGFEVAGLTFRLAEDSDDHHAMTLAARAIIDKVLG